MPLPINKEQEVVDFFDSAACLIDLKGPARAMSWKSREQQLEMFGYLAQLFPQEGLVSVNDLGCGFGEFAGFIAGRLDYYNGYDIAPRLIEVAKKRWQAPNVRFFVANHCLYPADYTTAAAIFSAMPKSSSYEEWEEHIRDVLKDMDETSRRGFGFNVQSHAHPNPYPHQYYGNPVLLEAWARPYGRVEIVKDAMPRWITVLVRKD